MDTGNPGKLTDHVSLGANYDDGFVAYLREGTRETGKAAGQEVTKEGVRS